MAVIGASTVSVDGAAKVDASTDVAVASPFAEGFVKIFKDLSLRPAARQSLPTVMKDLQGKTYTELFAIKLNDETQTCLLTTCGDVNPATVIKLAEAVLSARDKEESVRTANVNLRIAVSGAILAVLSFAMSAWTTLASLRSKK
jgi:hypothetical protein